MDLALKGLTALVAEADCEAGATAAWALAREGASVRLQGGSEAALTDLAEAIAAAGLARPALHAGQSTGEAVRGAIAAGREIDIAVSVLPPLREGRLTAFDDDGDLKDGWRHVGSTVELFQAASAGMKARGSGRLIFVGPVEAKAITGRDADIERAVALGVLGMMKAVSGEVGPSGVTVNSILWDSAPTGEARTRILDGLGAGVAYFASPLSNFLTGLAIAVDEGKHGGVF